MVAWTSSPLMVGTVETGRRRFELVEVGQIAADQDDASFDLVGQQRRNLGIGKQVDRQAE